MMSGRLGPAILVAMAGLAAIAAALWNLRAAGEGVATSVVSIDGTPATVFRPADGSRGPVVVIAHGFAGSQQLMQSFALAFARNGYTAVTFDFAGHGRNTRPLGGSISREDGATRRLVEEVARVAAYAGPLGDGRLALLGHSLASDIVIRFAQSRPDVAATIAVSMFSPVVTATSPSNLLVVVGDWEGMLKTEAQRVVGLGAAPAAAREGVTYGDPVVGTARRAAFSPHVEHVGVLFSQASLLAAVDWLDLVFGVQRSGPPRLAARGPWILALLAGVVALAWPLSRLLPVVTDCPAGAALRWRDAWVLAVPMIVTPLVLTVLPTRFLPVLVGDYLAAHFAAYGALTGLCLLLLKWRHGLAPTAAVNARAFAAAVAAALLFSAVALFWPIDAFVTSFVADTDRAVLVLALLAGTLPYFSAFEHLKPVAGLVDGPGPECLEDDPQRVPRDDIATGHKVTQAGIGDLVHGFLGLTQQTPESSAPIPNGVLCRCSVFGGYGRLSGECPAGIHMILGVDPGVLPTETTNRGLLMVACSFNRRL